MVDAGGGRRSIAGGEKVWAAGVRGVGWRVTGWRWLHVIHSVLDCEYASMTSLLVACGGQMDERKSRRRPSGISDEFERRAMYHDASHVCVLVD